jgi:hypothetical protein
MEALRVEKGWGSHIFRHSAHRWWQGCQPYEPVAFYLQEDSWYSFLLEAESSQSHSVAGRIRSIEKFYLIRDLNRRLSGL